MDANAAAPSRRRPAAVRAARSAISTEDNDGAERVELVPKQRHSAQKGREPHGRGASDTARYHVLRCISLILAVLMVALAAIVAYVAFDRGDSGAKEARRARRVDGQLMGLYVVTPELQVVEDAKFALDIRTKPAAEASQQRPAVFSAAGIAAATLLHDDTLACDPANTEISAAFADRVVTEMMTVAEVAEVVGNHHKTPTIFVLNQQLPSFVQVVLGAMYRRRLPTSTRFTLVSGSCGGDGPLAAFIADAERRSEPASQTRATTPHDRFEQLLHCPYLRRWFASGLDIHHRVEMTAGKLRALPVGVPSALLRDAGVLESQGKSFLDRVERTGRDNSSWIMEATTSPGKLAATVPRVFVPFSCAMTDVLAAAVASHRTTKEILQRICTHVLSPKQAGLFVSAVDGAARWDAMRAAGFVLCPPPAANTDSFDSPVVWEALAVGAVPIVLRTRTSVEMLRGLPIVFVTGFTDAEISRVTLSAWVQQLRASNATHMETSRRQAISLDFWQREVLDG